MDDRVADVWADHRAYLVDVAFRMIGSISDAEDIVQEAFTRLLRVEIDDIDDRRAWLTTVVGRLCIDHLRSTRYRREAAVDRSFLRPGSRADQPPSTSIRRTGSPSTTACAWHCSSFSNA